MTQNTGWGPQPWGAGWLPPQPPQPGVIPLRPLKVGEMVGGAFSTLGRHWKVLFGIPLAVQAVGILVLAVAGGIGYAVVHEDLAAVFDTPYGESPDDAQVTSVLALTIPLGAGALLLMLLGMFMIIALAPAVVQEAVSGRPTPFRALWRRTWSRLPAVFGASLLSWLIAAAPMLAAFGVAVALAAATAGDGEEAVRGTVLVFPLLFLAAVPVSTWLYVRLSLAPGVAVCEGLGPVTSLRRSARLVRGAWWRVFGLNLLASLVAGILSYLIQLPFVFGGMLGLIPAMLQDSSGTAPTVGVIAGIVVYIGCLLLGVIVSQVFQMGFVQLCTTLAYVDQRLRREDLAAALMAAHHAPPYGPAAPGRAG
ncbi:hypothetical protein LG634_18575 [Streptomyces bambusae]|uniref:hypothetical protein n=1 Tax=Streptomyces bambusae TaxID=1550616 RepID=UPI001CFEBACB|nr:hypothetical protein [Streptomyces bambusae]MCB5166840.1 hypothetical protein [Streptomyces bambusae]